MEKLAIGRKTAIVAFDICFMDDGEIQKQLEDRLAARDVAEATAEKDDKVPDNVDSEHFVPCSR